MNPVQLSIIASASLQVIMEHYTHLTKGDAYDAMLQAIAGGGNRRRCLQRVGRRRPEPAPSRPFGP